MVAPNMEASVSRMLSSLNFEHLVFRVRRQVVFRGRIIERLAPVFPGYIFVLARNAWALIKNIIGVRGFVCFGGQLQDVPDRIVESLRAQADPNGVLPWRPPEYRIPGFKMGDPVSVFFDQGIILQGIFRNLLAPDRAVIWLDWFGRAVPVSVNVGDLTGKPRSRPRRRPRFRRPA
jgi:transcription antitermination factor NusG